MFSNNFLEEKIFLPIGDLITGQNVSKHLHFLMKSKYWTRNEIDNFQNKKLKTLIKHAYDTVPYYSDLFAELKLTPNDIQTKEDLIKLPIINKATLKKEGLERFSSTNYPKNKIMRRSSSGSTGEPLHYLSTKESYSVNLATNLRGWYDMGFQLGDRYVKLSGNERKSKIKKIQDYLSNNQYISVNPMNNETFKMVLEILEDYKPKVIRCYPDLLLFLANFKVNHPEFTFSPESIATTGNMLFTEDRAFIEQAFNSKIFDAYSCEGNSCIFECSTHSCYHSSEEYGITEVVDRTNNPIKSGVGRLITTDLWNLAYPFIRYDTQDLVELDPSPCMCGRSHLRINKIIGRDNEVLLMPSGKRFIVHQFTIFFSSHVKLNESVEQFQVIKMKDKTIILKIVINERFTLAIKNYILDFWQSDFETAVQIEIVDSIPLLGNNKRRFIINE